MSQKRLRDKLWNEFFSCSENGTRQSPLARPNDPLSRRHLSRNLFGESKNAKPTLLSVSIFVSVPKSEIHGLHSLACCFHPNYSHFQCFFCFKSTYHKFAIFGTTRFWPSDTNRKLTSSTGSYDSQR